MMHKMSFKDLKPGVVASLIKVFFENFKKDSSIRYADGKLEMTIGFENDIPSRECQLIILEAAKIGKLVFLSYNTEKEEIIIKEEEISRLNSEYEEPEEKLIGKLRDIIGTETRKEIACAAICLEIFSRKSKNETILNDILLGKLKISDVQKNIISYLNKKIRETLDIKAINVAKLYECFGKLNLN